MSKMIPFATVKTLYATKVNKAETDAAKLLRSRLRSNFALIAEAAPEMYGAKGTVKEVANDKRPWGDLPTTFVRDVLKIDVPTNAPARTKRTKATK